MKKIILFSCLAFMLPLFSCIKNNGNGNENQDEGGNNQQQQGVDNPPSHSSDAMKLNVVEDAGTHIKTIEYTEDGRYLVVSDLDVKSWFKENETFVSGAYTVVGKVYTMAGFGVLEMLDETSARLSRAGLESVILRFTKLPPVLDDNSLTTFICRAWKLERTVASLTGKNLPASVGAGVTVYGSDIYKIASGIKEDYNISDEDLDLDSVKGMVIQCISFTRFGTLLIEFTDPDLYEPFVVEYLPYSNTSGNTFHYEFSNDKTSVGFIEGEADGKITRKADNTLWIEANALGVNEGEQYSGKVTFVLSQYSGQ